jgi:hypothetical protein
MGVSCQRHAPAALYPREKGLRLCQGSNPDRPVVQPVARHYTDWATQLTERIVTWHKQTERQDVDPVFSVPARRKGGLLPTFQRIVLTLVWVKPGMSENSSIRSEPSDWN